MNKTLFKPALLTLALLLGACSSLPKTTGQLDQARWDYRTAQDNPKVVSYAQAELTQARMALDLANDSASRNESEEDINKLAYTAKQKIALAQEKAKQKSAELDVAGSSRERDQMRLDQRTREADQARYDTRVSQNETRLARERADRLEQQLSDLSAQKTERGLVITLGDVLFGTDQSRLTATGYRSVQKVAEILQQNPQRTVLIEGFTDSTGSASYNQDLSAQRSNAVRTTLLEMGIAPERVATRAYGEAFPVANNSTRENRQLNRRVEIVISNASGQISQR